MLVSIIIPVYNEHSNIKSVLSRVLAASFPPGVERELIVVDDGSNDGTGEIIHEFKDRIQIYRSTQNRGKGWTLRLGLSKANGEVIVIQDADNEYNPEELPNVVLPILRGEANVVYGSRFKGTVSGMKFQYWLVNKLLAWAVRLLYGQTISDEATAYKAFRGSLIKSIPLTCQRFEFCPEVTAKLSRMGEKIVEVPISYQARTIKEGKKIRLFDAFQAFWTLIRYRTWCLND